MDPVCRLVPVRTRRPSLSRGSTRRAALAAVLALVAACESPAPSSPAGGAAAAGLAVLHSDYVSASLSLVDPAMGALLAENVLHSGSRAPRLSTALSGDVVLSSTFDPRGHVTLVDRYPNAVVTSFDPVTGAVVGQLPVGTGFAANPQDVAFLPDGRAYVPRFDANPAPTAAADDLDEGDDLLIVDLARGARLGRIPLAAHVPEGVRARPTQVALAGGRVWVALAALAADFSRGAEGRVVGVDPARDAVDRVVSLPAGANCGDLALSPDGATLWVACSGVWQEGAAAQLARSGLARVDLAVDPPALAAWLPAASLAGAPLAAEVAVDGRGRPWVVAAGDLEAGTSDRLLVVAPGSGAAHVAHDAGEAFVLGGLLADPARGRVWAAEARPQAPRLLAFETTGAGAPALAVSAGPGVGLPPRGLAWFGAAGPSGASSADAGGGRADPDAGGEGAGDLRAPDRVVAATFGPGAGFGQDRLPDVVLDVPAEGGGVGAPTDVLSLGHGGSIVLAFDAVELVDGAGPDFRVHENVLVPAGAHPRDPYAEVAIVSVSADGEDWRTFPFDYVPAGAHVLDRFRGFAGLRPAGDAFDLAAVGLPAARFVRIEDAGRAARDGAPDTRRPDVDGEFLDDPGNLCCAGTNEGFDLDGVAAIHWR
jgi:hypothetical protein